MKKEEPYALKHYLNAINYTKEKLMDADDEMWEKKYPSFIVNKALSAFEECILLVNELNIKPHIDKKLQFSFLINSVRIKKRFSPWLRKSKINDLDICKEYYGYNNEKAKEALRILTKQQLQIIKQKLNRGGTK
jgi:hypothetical protein